MTFQTWLFHTYIGLRNYETLCVPLLVLLCVQHNTPFIAVFVNEIICIQMSHRVHRPSSKGKGMQLHFMIVSPLKWDIWEECEQARWLRCVYTKYHKKYEMNIREAVLLYVSMWFPLHVSSKVTDLKKSIKNLSKNNRSSIY